MNTLSQHVIDAIEAIEDQEEFDEKLAVYLASPSLDRDDAVNALRARHPEFDTASKFPSEDVAKMMKEWLSDTSDMGGMN